MRPQDYEQYNVTGKVPGIREMASAIHQLERNPRVMSAVPTPNALMFLFETSNRKIEKKILDAFKEAGWSFTHAAIDSIYQIDDRKVRRRVAAFHVLVAL